MNPNTSPWAIAAFAAVILGTFLAAWKGRRDAAADAEADITKQCLNRWLVGLSAGATANSGFVVTGAVGLGYAYGVYWLLLPLAWFAGDLVFWRFFPHRLNAYAARSSATTLSNLIGYGLKGRGARALTLICTVLVVVCMGGYTMAQWVAGQKFVDGAFGFSGPLGARPVCRPDHRLLLPRALPRIRVRRHFSSDSRGSPAPSSRSGRCAGRSAVTRRPFRRRSAARTRGSSTCSAAARSPPPSDSSSATRRPRSGFGLGQPQVTNRYFAARDPGRGSGGEVDLHWVRPADVGDDDGVRHPAPGRHARAGRP